MHNNYETAHQQKLQVWTKTASIRQHTKYIDNEKEQFSLKYFR